MTKSGSARRLGWRFCCASALLSAAVARADALHDWNVATGQILFDAKVPSGPGYRAAAMAQTAVYEAVNAITARYNTHDIELQASTDMSPDAAIAAANRVVLSALVPTQQPAIDATYQVALAAIPDGAPKTDAIALGEAAAQRILSARADDGADVPEDYRPYTTPGSYVPTTIPLASQWPRRRPWALSSADQFRPGPPPALTSERWASDLNESRRLGPKDSTQRTPEQTDVAHFWETSGPIVYFPLVRSVTEAPGRELTSNARLLALAAQAMDDALIAVFDAKYTYNFWRPITAIRNADLDGNDATERAATWLPLIETPMHPEYPCAHCTVAGAVGAVIETEVHAEQASPLQGTSPTLPGVPHAWISVDAFVDEVANARVWGGLHYRNSAEVGAALGRKVGNQVMSHALKSN